MREYSTPAAVDIPPSAGLTDVIFERAARDPGVVVMRRKDAAAAGGWQDVTARQFTDDVTALAKGLIAARIAVGDRVALMSRTRYEWTVADYAIWSAGATTVPIYETSSAEQVEWILADSGARALIVETQAHLQTAAESLPAAPHVTRVWQIESPAGPAGQGEDSAGLAVPGHPVPVEPLTTLAAAGAGISDDEMHQRRRSRHAADLATIIYTSGTTGRPKGCELSHGNLLADVRNVMRGWLPAIFETPGAATLLFLPLAHSFARIIQVGCLESGVVLGHTPSVATLLPDLAAFRPTFILAVPRVFEKVYNGAEQRASASPVRGRIFRAAARTAVAWSQASGTDAAAPSGGPGAPLRLQHALFDRLVYAKLRGAVGGKVRYAVSGGGPLGERLGHFFRGAGITILEGYGLTESSAAATVNRPDHIKLGSVGQPLPGVSVKIADDGEIFLAGPTIFHGYWRNDEATAEVMADGWLRTGDIGELDDDGFLRVTGRKKELIVTAGGKNVAPAVLEDRIRAHPLVSQVLVVGDARPYVASLITLDEESVEIWKAKIPRLQGLTMAEIAESPELRAELQGAVDEGNKAVSRAEAVRRFRVLPGDFTEQGGHLTPSLKVRRNVIMKDFADEVEALYS
jgi:long-chain acyl-CoA synthetase